VAYVSLYRKWRPRLFSDVVGQQHVVRTLSNALGEGRIAHAYLFTGPRGTGKTTVARLLAKGLNCVNGPTAEPCGQCPSCTRIAEGMARSEEHTSELQSRENLVCRLLLEKK